MTPPRSSRVLVSIDELVLRGVPDSQASLVVATVQERLSLLAAGDPATLGTLMSGSIPLVRPRPARGRIRTAGALGRHVADGIWASARSVR